MHLLNPDADDPRRDFLVRALATGVFASGLLPLGAQAETFGRPRKLPPGQSIYRLNGEAQVNGQKASMATPIAPGDTVKTGPDSELVFVVGANAMIVRADSELTVAGGKAESGGFFVSALRLITGKLLSVSRNQAMSVRTSTATVGIRGTGFYIESDPELTYFCTCYGVTDVQSNVDPNQTDSVSATHHDRPLYITAEPGTQAIRNAGFRNHTDQELMLIETLTGRSVPFVFPGGDGYGAPRRGY